MAKSRYLFMIKRMIPTARIHGIHANALRFWPVYPKFIREQFLKAFSKNAMNGQEPRPTDNDWQIVFTQLRDCIVKCPCGGETFLNLDGDSLCINCGLKIPRPPVLLSQNRYKVALFPGMKLYRCHTDPGQRRFQRNCRRGYTQS